ncbi:YdbC family protein [Parageobacillus sp. VR-IP]|uniref:YdbC family protein n=1 Tax=Parageobacillus sp. VR-IP TaxID=2742205 RepID=UPI001581F645|nr:YdbC family protein [Parageobacillus sp. VR-IP]NUK30113.1 YdbC family protein [Parageobacillus sp. VR-IP]
MLLKWIRCEVDEEKKAAFSAAQETWRDLKGYPGFLGQIGGWNVTKPQEACILAFWENLDYYQSFMSNKHDEIFDRSRQKGTYHKIAVDMVEVKQPAEFNHMIMSEVLQKSKKLYVIHSNRINEKQTLSDRIKQDKQILATFLSENQFAVICTTMELSQSEWKDTPHTQVKLESVWTVV